MNYANSDKQKIYNLKRKLDKCEQMVKVLQLATCTARDSAREKLVAAELLVDQFPVHVVCDALNLSRGTYYNHTKRNKNDEAWFLKRDEVLKEKILETFNDHEQRIGFQEAPQAADQKSQEPDPSDLPITLLACYRAAIVRRTLSKMRVSSPASASTAPRPSTLE